MNTHFLMPNSFNTIITPYMQMPSSESVHFVHICLMMQLGYRLLLISYRPLISHLTIVLDQLPLASQIFVYLQWQLSSPGTVVAVGLISLTFL